MKKITIALLGVFLVFVGILMLSTTSVAVPVNSVPVPTNETTERGLNPTLSITITNPNGPLMNQSFWSNSSGTWAVFASNHLDSNGTLSNATANFTAYSTTYYWSSNVTNETLWDNPGNCRLTVVPKHMKLFDTTEDFFQELWVRQRIAQRQHLGYLKFTAAGPGNFAREVGEKLEVKIPSRLTAKQKRLLRQFSQIS